MFKDELTNKVHSLKNRLQFFNSVISEAALYSCSTWAMSCEWASLLRTTQRSMLRKVIGAKWMPENDIENEDFVTWLQRSTQQLRILIHDVAVKDWVEVQRKRQWKLAGSTLTHNDGRWSQQAIETACSPSGGGLQGCRKQGRPQKRCADDIESFIREVYGASKTARVDWLQVARCKKT